MLIFMTLEQELTDINIKDLTNIDFPRPITESEVDDLIRYIIFEADNNNPKLQISINFSANRHYGRELVIKQYESLEDVAMRKGDIKLSGFATRIINSTKPQINSAGFSFRSGYDALDRPVFEGIDFQITPGYEPGDLSSDDLRIMKDVKEATVKYFSANQKNVIG